MATSSSPISLENFGVMGFGPQLPGDPPTISQALGTAGLATTSEVAITMNNIFSPTSADSTVLGTIKFGGSPPSTAFEYQAQPNLAYWTLRTDYYKVGHKTHKTPNQYVVVDPFSDWVVTAESWANYKTAIQEASSDFVCTTIPKNGNFTEVCQSTLE